MQFVSVRVQFTLIPWILTTAFSAYSHGQGCRDWQETIAKPTYPSKFAMTYDSARGVTLVFGGQAHNGVLGDLRAWDGSDWTLLSETGPSARRDAKMAFDSARGVSVLYGGYEESGARPTTTWEWNGTAWTERNVAGPGGAIPLGMVYDSVRGVSVMVGTGSLQPVHLYTWEWDGDTWVDRSSPFSGPGGRTSTSLAFDSARGVTVLYGGFNGSYSASARKTDTWEWNGANWSLRDTNGPKFAWNASMAFDSAEGVTVAYCRKLTEAKHEMWQWDGSQWTQRVDEGPTAWPQMVYDSQRDVLVQIAHQFPDSRVVEWQDDIWQMKNATWPYLEDYATMVYDDVRDVSVLYGRTRDYSRVETWEFDGISWNVKSDTSLPVYRDHAMAYDAAHGVTVAFGGLGASGYSGETWLWDGVAWTMATATGPAARGRHAMAYDAGRDVVVLFGGEVPVFDEPPMTTGDTWEWDGTTWTERIAAGPEPREQHSMAYDASRGVVVLFGGYDQDGTHLTDTWEWNGSVWTLVATEGPPGRDRASMTYDSDRGVVVLFGGYADGFALDDTWEWNGSAWRELTVSSTGGMIGSRMVYDELQETAVQFNGSVWNLVPYDLTATPPTAAGTVSMRSRYLTIDTTDETVAIRVVPVDLPAGMEQYEGRAFWLNDLSLTCENSGQALGPCNPVEGFASPVMATATLGCNPEYRVWNSYGAVNVFDEHIVPGGSYVVQTIRQTCDVTIESVYSAPLPMITSSWADVGGPYDNGSGAWSAPDGQVNIPFDVVAILDKFMNNVTAPSKARVDLQPSIPDQIIDVQDLNYALDAFRGGAYPFTPTSPPCGG